MTKDANQTVTVGIAGAQGPNPSDNGLRYRTFIENSVACAWRIDFEEPISLDLPPMEQVELMYRYGYCGEANQTVATVCGFERPAEMIGVRLEEFLPRNLPTSIPFLARLAEANYCANGWASFEQDRYGNRKVFVNNCIGEFEDGTLLRVWGTSREVSREKQLEEEVYLRSQMFEQVPDGCVVVEVPPERIVYVNAAFTRITGYTVSEIRGEKLSFLQGAGTDPDVVAQIREALEQERSFMGVILNYKRDGTPFWNSMRISPIKDNTGVVTHYIGILTDITEQKRIQEDLYEQRAQLAHIARVAAMGELTAALAHELKQPLSAILMNAQAAQRFLDKENGSLDEVREILKDIVADDKRASEVLGRIRRLAKRDGSRSERVSVNQLVAEVHQLLSNDLAIKQVRFSAQLAPDLPAVQGDQVQLQQVILNLVINACQALEGQAWDKRRIMVATRSLDDQAIEVSVADSGRGVDEKILDRIFQPFFTTKDEGMGMGLAINRTIVEAHGGRLWAESGLDEGAVFRITLPIVR